MSSGIVTEMNVLLPGMDTLSTIETSTRLGRLFAVIVNEQNEIHRSITVNILHGAAQGIRRQMLCWTVTCLLIIFVPVQLNSCYINENLSCFSIPFDLLPSQYVFPREKPQWQSPQSLSSVASKIWNKLSCHLSQSFFSLETPFYRICIKNFYQICIKNLEQTVMSSFISLPSRLKLFSIERLHMLHDVECAICSLCVLHHCWSADLFWFDTHGLNSQLFPTLLVLIQAFVG